MENKKENFENECMDVIEGIVSSSKKLDRQGAIDLTKKKLAAIKETNDKHKIAIYTRVLKEFKISTDKEYNLLKKMIFSTK